MAITDFFNSTAVVQQPTTTWTTMGGNKRTFSTRIAALSCRVGNPKAMHETGDFGKMTVRETMMCYCEATATNRAIKEADRIVVDGKTFEVINIYDPCILNRHLEIKMEVVR